MHYYVDGYNLMFRLSTARDDLSRYRQQLIEDLNAKIQLLDLDVTIVFDSQYQPGGSTRSHYQNLEILFTNQGETADERILDEIRGEKYQALRVTVVTSDKKLAWFARRCSAATESVEDFISWLNKRCRNRLRQRKEAALAAKNPKPLELPKRVPQKKSGKPAAEVSPEKCTDYYLEAFQKELVKLEAASVQTKEIKKAAKGSKARKPRTKVDPFPVEEQDNAALDMDRWLLIFERKLQQD